MSSESASKAPEKGLIVPRDPEPLPMLSIEQALACPDGQVIDLRSPAEFADDHLPGARNLPLFGDLQRAMVGFLYRQVSPQSALEKGADFAAGRVESLVAEIAAIAAWKAPAGRFEERVKQVCAVGVEGLESLLQPAQVSATPKAPIILHCWRGGLRSRSVVALMRGLGLTRAVGLSGGYKAYRQRVMRQLATWSGPRPFVLHGLTGVGKTLVLNEIEVLRPGWTLDLEALAGHRSSILGMVGKEPCGQKEFDSRLALALEHRPAGPLVVEGESRKVGDVVLPTGLWGAMESGHGLWLSTSLETRIQVLLDDYLGDRAQRAPLRRQLVALSRRLPPTTDWLGLFDGGREAELVRRLLEHHYDPLYRKTVERHFETQVSRDLEAEAPNRPPGGAANPRSLSEWPAFDTTEPARAAAQIVDWIEGEKTRSKWSTGAA